MACNKRAYDTENLAVEALLGARVAYAGNTSISVYLCEDCGKWHLSSKGNVNGRLAKELASGKIERQREADFWERKLR